MPDPDLYRGGGGGVKEVGLKNFFVGSKNRGGGGLRESASKIFLLGLKRRGEGDGSPGPLP